MSAQDPPVVKILDYGKWSYEQAQREKEAKKKQRTVSLAVKELQFRLKIEDHDYETKAKHGQKFLESGHDVKVVVTMRGRERSHPEIADRLVERILDDLVPEGEKRPAASREGARISALIRAPKKD